MTTSASEAGERNARLYPWYAACYNAFFWMPIFFLYFGDHLDLGGVLYLEAIYYTGVVVLEIPSGYLSDSVGRRPTLLLSSGLLVLAYAGFALGSGFWTFAAAQIGLAGGISFQSGTGTSFLYDSLADAGREEDYEQREAAVGRTSLGATAIAAVLGGVVGSWDLRAAYVLSCVAALGALLVVLQFTEPTRSEDAPGTVRHFGGQLVECLGYLRQPVLLWFFGYAVAMTVINHLPYEFYQPYIELLGGDWGLGESAPAATGIHMGATTLLGASAAAWSAWLSERVGRRPLLLAATALQAAVLGAMCLWLHPVVVAVVLLRGVPAGVARAPLRAGVTPRVDRAHRATYLSIQSLTGRLGFAGVLATLGGVAGARSPESWEALSTVLTYSALLAVGAFLLLAAAAGLVRGSD